MIAFHHRVRPYRAEHARLVEPFRRADWNDFTMGVVRGGIPRDLRKAAEADLPVADVAKRMGINAATVRVHLHRGRARLRELLGAEETDDA